MKYGPLDIKRMKPNDRVWQLMVDVLWRELPGLYVEKYMSQGDPAVPAQAWLKGEISENVDFGIYLGQDNLIEGNRSVAIGQGLNTKSFMEILLGAYATIAANQDPDGWSATDRLVTIGNGLDADNRSNAFEMFKSGLLKLHNGILFAKYEHGGVDPVTGILQFDAGKLQLWIDTAWNELLTDAPSDGKIYGRKDASYVEVAAADHDHEIGNQVLLFENNLI